MAHAVVIVPADESDPIVHGPFDSATDALRFEDRHVDAPAGARAFIVPMTHEHDWRDVPGFTPGTKQTCTCGAYRYPTVSTGEEKTVE
jgi:hypothetical protein